MKSPEHFASRREQLSTQISRQRGDFLIAYRNLEKPIHYAEYGLRGFGFVRQYPWIFVAGPSLLSLVFSSFGFMMRRGQPRIEKAGQRQGFEDSRRSKRPLLRWLGRGYAVFKLYRRLRPFFL